jgi:L-alanine-DL-glutamate epimerase-like enolase superfamily enzyme
MPIARVEAFPMRYEDPNDAMRLRCLTLVRIETSDGVVGWGEAVAQPADAALATKVVVERGFAPLLIGGDPREVRRHWDRMRRHTFWSGHGGIATFAISAVDMALWDIAGKLADLPVHALLGGRVHDRLRACASVIWETEDIEGTAAQFGRFAAQGYTAVKGGWGLNHEAVFGLDARRDIALVTAVREAIGPDVDFVADVAAWAKWTVPHAIRMGKRLEEAGLSWLEDALPESDYAGFRRLRHAIGIPIATGEREWTVEGYNRLFQAEATDIVLIDPGRAEGITGMKLATDDARMHGINVVPHSWSSAINTAAALNVLAASPNVQVFELKEHPNAATHQLVREPYAQSGGWLEIPDRVGLGVEVDETVVRELTFS